MFDSYAKVTPQIPEELQPFFNSLKLPDPDSHKGQNGKLLIIGGSDLFHAASRWSLDVASKFVDMVFYSSVPSNNDLIKDIKGEFWNGIVIERKDIETYLQEADSVLIGPGMTRSPETAELTNRLLIQYPQKKWVIDAGALQMVDPKLLTRSCILTPHHQEFVKLLERAGRQPIIDLSDDLTNFSQAYRNACVLVKGRIDFLGQDEQFFEIAGGNAGMTKGGTGDVLAGVVAGLYATNDQLVAAAVGSFINKRAGDLLYKEVGPFFNSTDLVQAVPEALWSLLD